MENLRIKLLKNIKWNFFIDIMTRLLQPLIMCVLARILVPQDFGLYSMAIVLVNFIVVLQDIAIGYGLIRVFKDDDEHMSVAFLLNIIFGVMCFIVLYAFAPWYGDYVNNISVSQILRALSIVFIVNAFYFTQRSLLKKRLQFYKLFSLNLVSLVVSGLVSISLALKGYGVWALVIGFIMGPVSSGVLIWFLVRWVPRLTYNTDIGKYFLHFGGLVIIESLLMWFAGNIAYIFVGKFLGPQVLGIYYFSFYLALLPSYLVAVPVISVYYSAFSRLRADKALLKDYYFRYISTTALIVFLFGLLIFFCSAYCIPLFFGAKWLEAIPLIRILTINGVLAALVIINFELFRAIGKIKVSLKFLLARCILSIPLYFWVAQKSIAELSYLQLLLACFFAPINIYICYRVVKFRVHDFYLAVKTPVLALIVSTICAYCFERYATVLITHNIRVRFLLMGFVVISSYLATIFFSDRKRFTNIWRMFAAAFSKTPISDREGI